MLWKLQSLRSVYSLTYQPSLWLVMFWVLRFPLNGGKTWDLGLRKKYPFPLNRGVPSTDVTDKKIIRIFAWGQILHPLNRGVTSTDVTDKKIVRILTWGQIFHPLNRGIASTDVTDENIIRIFTRGQILHPLIREVPSTDATHEKIIRILILPGAKFCIPWIEVSL